MPPAKTLFVLANGATVEIWRKTWPASITIPIFTKPRRTYIRFERRGDDNGRAVIYEEVTPTSTKKR